MKVTVKSFQAVAVWRWELGNNASSPSAQPQPASAGNDDGAAADDDSEDEDEVCGICRAPFDGTCPDCKVPGDDCPLIWGQCTHVFHMHCLLKWVDTESSKGQCPMDRRPWVTAERS